MGPVRCRCKPFVEVSCTEGSAKAPWRVHEASSAGPGRNLVGFLHDGVCIRFGPILYCFLDPMLLTPGNPF